MLKICHAESDRTKTLVLPYWVRAVGFNFLLTLFSQSAVLLWMCERKRTKVFFKQALQIISEMLLFCTAHIKLSPYDSHSLSWVWKPLRCYQHCWGSACSNHLWPITAFMSHLFCLLALVDVAFLAFKLKELPISVVGYRHTINHFT